MHKSTRKSITITSEESFDMAVSAAIALGNSESDAMLEALLLSGMTDDDEPTFDAIDEIIEVEEESDIEAAVAALDKADANKAVYADEVHEEISGEDVPKEQEVKATKPAKAKAVKEPKAVKAPKEPAAPRVTYVGHSTSEVLAARLGEAKSELLMLEVDDVELSSEELEAKQSEILSAVDSLAKKVGLKAVMLFSWVKSGGTLNDVMKRAFEVLAKDGHIDSGPKGNLQINLLTKYTTGTAASQANQIQALFPALAITVREKGHMTANPNSLILMKAKAELGLA